MAPINLNALRMGLPRQHEAPLPRRPLELRSLDVEGLSDKEPNDEQLPDFSDDMKGLDEDEGDAPVLAPRRRMPMSANRLAIVNPRAFLLRHHSKWNTIRKLYKDGILHFETADSPGPDKHGNFDIAKAQRKHAGMNAMLAFRLEETLLKDNIGNLSHNFSIMQTTQNDITREEHEKKRQELLRKGVPGPDAKDQADQYVATEFDFGWNYGAGTGSATSDIDSNLSGYGSERAVEVFNSKFRNRWGKESGVVFDVNVYARDYLPITGAYSLIKANKSKQQRDPHGQLVLSTAEFNKKKFYLRDDTGQRSLTVVKFETDIVAKSRAYHKAMIDEEVYSLVKMRMDMSQEDWTNYRKAITGSLARGRKDKRHTEKYDRERMLLKIRFDKAERIYAEREEEINTLVNGFNGPDAPVDRDEKVMLAENTLYAKRLKEVARLRRALRTAQNEGAPPMRIEQLHMLITKALHQAALFANEAYVTGAAVLHVVGNKQLLSKTSDDPLATALDPNRGKNLKIKLTADQFMHAFNENMAFVFKDLTIYSADPNMALLKASKYLYRAAVAANFIKKDSKQQIWRLHTFNYYAKRLLARKLEKTGGDVGSCLDVHQRWSRRGGNADDITIAQIKEDFYRFMASVQKSYSKSRFTPMKRIW